MCPSSSLRLLHSVLGRNGSKAKDRFLLRLSLTIVVVTSVLLYLLVFPGNHIKRKEIISQPDNPVTSRGLDMETMTDNGSSGEQKGNKCFTKVIDADHYMYSAIVNVDGNIQDRNMTNTSFDTNYTLDIVITSLDASSKNYNCCVIFSDIETPFVTPANLYFTYSKNRNVYLARQYSCQVPMSSEHNLPQKLTLATSSSCSTNPDDYVTILYPSRHPGRIALCGKVVYGGGRDPEKVIEWFEMQRILGVDKILIYDLGNPENLTRVFRYYQKLGLLDVQPYEMPGNSKNRSFTDPSKNWYQYDEDQTMPVLECRQRMGGYDYVISHDLDEMIIPRKHVTLKTFFQDCVARFPKAASFFFHTEYFITTWQPTNPEEDLMVKRYRRATLPRWERYKYFYRPPRVLTSTIHTVVRISQKFHEERISPDIARLHHYRKCPKGSWGTCEVASAVDDVMMRYADLDERVLKVKAEVLPSS